MLTSAQRPRKLPELAGRQRDILHAVIRDYIATAQPVASVALVRRYRLPVSPATVRNALAALEELGLLTHPHTSAGRVPTDLGYRYFIESLMPAADLRPEERVTVSHQFQQAERDTGEWLRLAASALARLATEAAIVTSPSRSRAVIRHLEAVPIASRRVLLVAVLDGGTVLQQLVDLSVPVGTEALRSLSARLVDHLSGKGVDAVRALAASASAPASELLGALERVLDEPAARARDVYYDGIQYILSQPEFEAAERVRAVLELLEDGTRLAQVLPDPLGEGEIHVAIGSEHRCEPLVGCSLVVGRYGGRDGVIGYVGVVGPTRMDYARSIGAVRYIGSLMTDLVRTVEGR